MWIEVTDESNLRDIYNAVLVCVFLEHTYRIWTGITSIHPFGLEEFIELYIQPSNFTPSVRDALTSQFIELVSERSTNKQ